jgi:hypothetical protein
MLPPGSKSGIWILLSNGSEVIPGYPSWTPGKDYPDGGAYMSVKEVPRKWNAYCDQVTDNFRIISPTDFRVLT